MVLVSLGKAYVSSDLVAWDLPSRSSLNMYILFRVLYIVTGQVLWTLDKTFLAESLVD
jgi:hypothetical protein